MKFVMSYSGGKDSALALHRAIQAGHQPMALLVTCDEKHARSWFHNIPMALLERISSAMGIPLMPVMTDAEHYEAAFEAALRACASQGAELCVFGDIDIQEHYDWCHARCVHAGMSSLFPLWHERRADIVAEMVDAGFSALITVVNHTLMREDYLGRIVSHALLAQLADEGVDICGENGEYHTFVYNGPIFRAPVVFATGPLERTDRTARIPILCEENGMDIERIVAGIGPLDEAGMAAATARLDSLIKPIGSLGRLEELAVQLAGITGDLNLDLGSKTTLIFCADNGVYEEGVSPAPQAITLMQSLNFQKGITGIGVLSRLAGSSMAVVDISINSDCASESLINRKIRKGTRNLAKEPAMTRPEVLQALQVGFEEAAKLFDQGCAVLGTGEMGLGNTTTSSLVIMALTGCDIDAAVGRGAGLSDEAFAHKKRIIQDAYNKHNPNSADPIDVLCKVGGYDIAGLAGAFLSAAYHKKPVVIDGIISAAAALVAYRLCPNARLYMVPSHASEEPGYGIAMKALGMRAYFNLGMRLGEGTGCPLTFLLIDASLKILREMATFEEVSMDNSKLVDIRK